MEEGWFMVDTIRENNINIPYSISSSPPLIPPEGGRRIQGMGGSCRLQRQMDKYHVLLNFTGRAFLTTGNLL
jgi:hypothetical protein